MKDQRFVRIAADEAEDAADQDQVVSARVLCFVGALEPCRTVGDKRYASQSRTDGKAVKTCLVTRRKALRERLLINSEHIDGVVLALRERENSWRFARQAPDDERRVERDRVE